MNGKGIEGMLNDRARWGLTLALGMLVLFWRIVLPTRVTITTATVLLTVTLDLALAAAVIYLNKNELKEAFSKRFTGKDVLKTVIFIVISLVSMNLFSQLKLILAIDGLTMGALISNFQDPVWLEQMLANAPGPAPSEYVAGQYAAVFPLGAFISIIVLAPVWEEIVFRMSGKSLIKNPILYVLITSCLFAFIHTVNFSVMDNSFYFVFGALYNMAYLVLKDVRILMIAHFANNVIAVLPSLLA